MSSVLVIIIIPDHEYELEVKEKEKSVRKLSKKFKKDLSSNLDNGEDNGAAISFEKIVQEGLDYLDIPDATRQKSNNGKYWHILFPVDLEDSDVVIQYFKSKGIGLRMSTSIGIIPFSLFCYNEEVAALDQAAIEQERNKEISFKEKQSKFLKSVTARLTVAQIVSSVQASATVTFDFICYLVFASWIAAMGLLDNSVISLVASMLVSPMMGPVMALTFGTIIKDKKLRNMGAKNILVCLCVTISFGFLFGMIALNFTDKWTNSLPDKSMTWPTNMMKERGLIRVAWVGTLVAFPSGCAVAISLLSGNDASLVGVAISVSLLPPAVNAGLLWAYSLLKYFYSINDEFVTIKSQFNNETIYLPSSLKPQEGYSIVYSNNMSIEGLFLGLLSLALSLINIFNIIVGALLFLKIKEIAPFKTLSPESRRFFQEDIRIAREYNEKSPSGNLGEDVLREWASITGLNTEDVMKPEARNVQLNTLVDIAKEVEADQVYQTITKNINNTDNVARRLSQGLLTTNKNDIFSRRQTLSSLFNQPSIVVTEPLSSNRRPSHVYPGHNRRRISTVALNQLRHENDQLSPKKFTNGIVNKAFTFNETEVDNQQPTRVYERNRRDSSALLRVTLQNESLWPNSNRFTVVQSRQINNDNPQSPPKST